ncbi:Mg(2+) chelatase family protein [Gracilibacillus boraciitolerans JCM 21714]|uniref:Mg(2+) chelatase family protein n=1 Tax=Gracilibacillus boraciitolerans JCM 21714 TaxID=1298598 RepID=W4VMG2_9BACI|nr:Mg(2+) chelatase family protein [Gracilibacillus boraciitolerans JCM 21714]
METGKVTISRTASTVTYPPTSFLLMAAMNSCPCGHLDSRTQYCTCTPKQVQAYQNRLSGPILDRFDIVLRLRPELIDKQNKKKLETSQTIRKRVAQARTRQVIRNNGIVNALLPNEDFFKHIHLNSKQEVMVQEWVRQYQWSTRVQMKVLRLARTIADLEGSQQISDQSLWEAMTMKRTKLETTKQRVVQ